MIPTVETERLLLREWRESDFGPYAKFRSDPVAAKFIGPMTVSEAWRAMVYVIGHWYVRGYGFWCLEEKASHNSVGYCGHYYPHDWPEPEIGWGIYPEYQRKGFAHEAARASLDYAYRKLGWKTAISLIANENEPSKLLVTRLGAVPEAPFEFNGTPCTIFRHLKPEHFQHHSKEKHTWH